MDIIKAAVQPCKLTFAFQLGVRPAGIAIRQGLLPYIPFAGERGPVAGRENSIVTEILVPNQCRVRFSAQHFAGQLEAFIRLAGITVHINKLPWRERELRLATGLVQG